MQSHNACQAKYSIKRQIEKYRTAPEAELVITDLDDASEMGDVLDLD